MGYLSDVAITLHNSVDLTEAPALVVDALYGIFTENDTGFSGISNGHRIYYISGFRWYLQNESVNAIENWLKTLHESQYRFMRIGENEDDIEQLGWFIKTPFRVKFVRKIKFQIPSML